MNELIIDFKVIERVEILNAKEKAHFYTALQYTKARLPIPFPYEEDRFVVPVVSPDKRTIIFKFIKHQVFILTDTVETKTRWMLSDYQYE